MLGSIIGDIIGSTYEFNPTKDCNFELFAKGITFTDDSLVKSNLADRVESEGLGTLISKD